MKMQSLLSIISMTLIVLSCGSKDSNTNDNPFTPGGTGQTSYSITWDASSETPIRNDASYYGRVHKLADGKILGCYETGSDICGKFYNGGKSWGVEFRIAKGFSVSGTTVNACNPDFLQLSSGRILLAYNQRTTNTEVYPYCIAITYSDDNGSTWSSPVVVYKSEKWNPNRFNGCWEPFVLEPVKGNVQIYFSDETPYCSNTAGDVFQNISVIESDPTCAKWSSPRVVSYSNGSRDGMPSATVYKDNIYVAIEDNSKGNFHPMIVMGPVSNSWSSSVGGSSSNRFNPIKFTIPSTTYAGAPYLIQTDDYFVLSYQDGTGSRDASSLNNATMKVVFCPKSEVENGQFKSMSWGSTPFSIDQTNNAVLWNSLCDLGGNKIMAVGTVGGKVCTKIGTITKQ